MSRSRPLGARLAATLARLATFRTVTVVLYRHARDTAPAPAVPLREVDATNVADARAMDPAERVEEFRGFLARGDRGWYAYVDGRVAHRSWLRRGPLTEALWLAWGRLALGAGDAYVHYCETAPAARGLGLYPAAIAHAAAEAKRAGARAVYISTDLANTASRRGIEKAGYDEVARVELRVRFGRASQRVVAGALPA